MDDERNNTPQQHAPETEGRVPSTTDRGDESQPGGFGPMVGIIIIIALLVLGALYFWGSYLNESQEQVPLIPGDENGSALPNGADNAEAIEDDFEDTDVAQLESELDATLDAIESEL